jgi:hypothetical protein
MNRPPPIPKASRSSRLWPAFVIAVVALPFLTVVGVYANFRVSNSRAVRRLEAKARAKSEPLTFAEIAAKYPPIPDGENAAVPLLDLWEKDDPSFWRAFRRGERPLPKRAARELDTELPFMGPDTRRAPRTKPLPAESRTAAEAFLNEDSNHLDAVRLALTRPHCRFPVPLGRAYVGDLPYLTEMRREAQSFRIAGALALERGDISASISALEDTRRAGRAVAEGPLLLDQLVMASCFSMVLDDAQRLLSQHSLDTDQLARMNRLFEGMQSRGALRTGLLAERAWALHLLGSPAEAAALLSSSSGEEAQGETASTRNGMGVLRTIGLTAADRRLVLETMDQAIALSTEDSPAALEQYDRLFLRVEDEAMRFPPKLISALVLPANKRAAARFAAIEARRRAGLVALALERYRLTHAGALPDKLDALGPDYLPRMLLDPFDGQPLRYRRLGTGFVVYSVGRSRKDHGGKERPEKGLAQDYDETFIVER